ncbi:MAG: hypothetical protein V4819_22575 [Verrucomicrobiota bacterium]
MTRKTQILLATHLCALGLAFGIAREMPIRPTVTASAKPLRTKSGIRDATAFSGDGEQLLAMFMNGQVERPPGKDSKYTALKASLPVAGDVRAAAVEEIEVFNRSLGRTSSDRERSHRLVIVEVRALHWMRQDPVPAMDFFVTNETCIKHRLTADFSERVFKDIIAESGLPASVAWLSKSPATVTLFGDSVLAAMKQGDGIELAGKLIKSMESDPGQTAYLGRLSERSYFSGRSFDPFFRRIGEAVRFDERSKLLEMAKTLHAGRFQTDLLAGFARSGQAAATWLLEAVSRGDLEGFATDNAKSEANRMIGEGAVPLEERLAKVPASQRVAGRSREDRISRMVSGDVKKLLKTGRDWGYEFHHGDVTAAEVLTEVKSELSGIPAEGEPAMREALYLELVEENPAGALPLIAGFPEEKRRGVLFGRGSQGLGRADPRLYSSFLATLPEPRTAEEVESVRNSLVYHAGRLLQDDGAFLNSVRAMPADVQRSAAIDVIVSATRARNPTEADKLEKQFSSHQP